MKVVGIIAEYNPFHNGHLYHIKEAKKQTGADYVIVIMSGNFVQRGSPAIINKYARTKSAIESGADLVIELPVVYSTSSAEFFALGAISILDQLGIVDYVCFGSETNDINALTSVAKYLIMNPDEYNKDVNKYMKSGITFPVARQKAIIKNNPSINTDIISSPNNILGVEYIKALLKFNSPIKPFTIERKHAGYHETDLNITRLAPTSSISSATALRKFIKEQSFLSTIETQLPDSMYNIFKQEYKKTFPVYDNDFSLLLKYKLLSEDNKSLVEYIDLSKDLANRINNTSFGEYDLSSYTREIKTKQWTHTRIKRVLIHILLDLKTKNLKQYNDNKYSQYARILGFNKDSSFLINKIKENTKIPILSKLSEADNILPSIGLQMLREDIYAANIYNLIIQEKFGTNVDNEFKQDLIIV